MDDPKSLSPLIPLADSPASTPQEPAPASPETGMGNIDKPTVHEEKSSHLPPLPPEPVPMVLHPHSPGPTPPSAKLATPPQSSRRGKTGARVVLVGVLLMLITLPLAVYYISQQQQVSDIRSRAVDLAPYPTTVEDCGFAAQDCAFGYTQVANGCTCKPDPYVTIQPVGGPCGGNNVCATGVYCYSGTCHIQGPDGHTCSDHDPCALGQSCVHDPASPQSAGTCVFNTDTGSCGRNKDTGAPVCCYKTGGSKTKCDGSNAGGTYGAPVCEGKRLECSNGTYWCTLDVTGCATGGGGGGSGGSNNTPTPTPVVAQCTAISVYKGDVLVTDYSTLMAGDVITVAVAPGTATAAHVRVNGGIWQQTTATNSSGAFIVSFPIPSGVTSVTIEAEIFVDGVWK